MKFFYKWLYKKLQNTVEDTSKDPYQPITASVGIERDNIYSKGMNFTVYRANGGFIIEHRVYNQKTDRHDNSLHIIIEDKDLGEEIGKIITFESLRS